MDRRTFLAAAGAGVTASAAGCLGLARETEGDEVVEMTIDSYRPEELTVSPGTTVEFLNTSNHGHTVTASDIPEEAEYFASGGFESYDAAFEGWEENNGGVFTQGDSFLHTFEVTGDHHYVCIPHLDVDMVGVVTVEE